MLVLLSFALVLAATVLLVLGLLNDDGLTLIYLSIACSGAAAVVLVVALRRNQPSVEVPVAPAALPTDVPPSTVSTPAAVPAAAPVVAASSDEGLPSVVEVGQKVDFPIAEYDDLTAGQILPLLPRLYPDEIPVVDARERATKARPEILDRLAQLRGDVPLEAATAIAPMAEVPAEASSGHDDWFPIEDFESLSVAKIRPLLRELDREELILVRDHEMALRGRRTLLDDIDRRLAPPKKVAAKKAPAKKAPAKKAPAKKAPAKKASAPTAEAPAAETPTEPAAEPSE